MVRRLVLCAGGLGLALLLAEAGLRVYEFAFRFFPAERELSQQYKRLYSDERDQPYLFGHQPNVSVRLSRGREAFTMITNAEGLRETQDYDALPQSVIFLGDSIIEGSSVENAEAVDAVFEQLTGIVALNFGLGSSNTVQQYHWLVGKYRPAYHTKLIVLGFCLNDLQQNTSLRAFDEASGNWVPYHPSPAAEMATSPPAQTSAPARTFKDVLRPYVKSSRALYALYGAIRRWIVGPPDPFPASFVTEADRRATEDALMRLREFADRIGSELIVVIVPEQSQLTRAYAPGGRIQDVLIEILDRRGIAYLDVYDLLRTAQERDPEVRWYYDPVHLHAAGHRLIAEYLVREFSGRFPHVFAKAAVKPASLTWSLD